MDRKRFSKKVLWIAGSIAVCIFCISAGIFLWNRQSKSQSTVKEKLDEVQEIQNINARDNVAEPDAFEGKELTEKEQKKLEEKLAEAVASTGQDEQNKQDTASKETNTQS